MLCINHFHAGAYCAVGQSDMNRWPAWFGVQEEERENPEGSVNYNDYALLFARPFT